ncbi:MAG: alcohol dehydrogenase catalytic domain-containing protein [Pseudomonadales bacterium]
MKAAVFGEHGQIRVVERERPEPRPGWVVLDVSAVGICGSDLNLLYASDGSKGVQPGHEVAGIVSSVGDGVDLASGSQVAVEPIRSCGTCYYCRCGKHNLCTSVRLFGFAAPGGMAEWMTVPASALYALPPDLPVSVAALAEPMAVCVRGARIARLDMHDRVAILGAGSIGLLSIVAARAAGAGEVLITARHPHQQELARALGADQVFDSHAALLAAVGDQHVDVVIETVGGKADTLDEAVQIARSGGRIVMLGVFEGSPSIPGMAFFVKELTLAASNCYGRESRQPDFAIAVQLVSRHAGLLAPLVTHTFSLDQVANAFATAADKSNRSIKVQVQP